MAEESEKEKSEKEKEESEGPKVVFVNDERPISEAVAIMVEKEISSVLVHDAMKKLVGIVTERDIVRKFTLLEMDDKMSRSVATIMTRGVHCIQESEIEKEVLKVHLEKKIRHFPIIKGKEAIVDNLVGMISITDYMRDYLLGKKVKKKSDAYDTGTQSKLGVIAKTSDNFLHYRKMFTGLGYQVTQVVDMNEFYNGYKENRSALLFDMDGFSQEDLKKYIVLVRKYPGQTIYATSQAALIAPFRRGLDKEKQAMTLKPVDTKYCNWFFNLTDPNEDE